MVKNHEREHSELATFDPRAKVRERRRGEGRHAARCRAAARTVAFELRAKVRERRTILVRECTPREYRRNTKAPEASCGETGRSEALSEAKRRSRAAPVETSDRGGIRPAVWHDACSAYERPNDRRGNKGHRVRLGDGNWARQALGEALLAQFRAGQNKGFIGTGSSQSKSAIVKADNEPSGLGGALRVVVGLFSSPWDQRVTLITPEEERAFRGQQVHNFKRADEEADPSQGGKARAGKIDDCAFREERSQSLPDGSRT